ncbi:MAG: glycoside hydrolase family 20 zincin-like fold domain-containing protein, partial [bacterium]
MMCRLAAAMALVGTCALAAEGETPPQPAIEVIPQPKNVSVGQGVFRVDRFCIVLVSERATRGTRRAARVVQLGLRKRFGMDVPIVRIAQQRRHGVTRPIWVVEPRLERPPAKTIGVRGLTFDDAMKPGGYFLRVDAIETVVHGADDAGSLHGARTFLQLIEPATSATLLRKATPPTVPCLWLQDWPSQRVRAVPSPFEPNRDASIGATESEQLIELGAHYKLNALP